LFGSLNHGYVPGTNADEILLNTLEIWVPRRVSRTMTTIAINTIINAYSTMPCPVSLGEYNIVITSYPLKIGKCSLTLYILYIKVSMNTRPIIVS
jgi:hypothetical protein